MGSFVFALITLTLAIVAVVLAVNAGRSADRHEANFLKADGSPGSTDKGPRSPAGKRDAWADARRLRLGAVVAASALFVLTAVLTAFSVLYTQGVGEAKVLVNIDGTVAGENLDPGFGVKAPWQSFSEWDLFSQEAVFAGSSADGTPSYSGGQVTGYEITSAVARGAQTNFDLTVTYTLDSANVTPLYKKYRDQERFTKQVIEKTILSVVRDIPTTYTPVEFRGDKRGEANDKMFKALNKKLNVYGVTVDLVNLQNIRYTAEVEESIKKVEVSQQKEETAQADLRAATVSAQTKVVEAQSEADANAILAASLSPTILQQRALDALVRLGDSGNVVVVPEGFAGILQLK